MVNGPSTDNTEEVLDNYKTKIKIGKCDLPNLSISRNIGICMAEGDIVAFIDDDAIPEPEWLEQLEEGYTSEEVGGVGGFVYDHTGYNFQYQYCNVNRFGNPEFNPSKSYSEYNFPFSFKIPHLLGCNSSFSKKVLQEIKGFDEEYEYFLDESDVCMRIVDKGYTIVSVPNAFVHHKYAPSHIREENKIIKHHFPIIKNTIYYSIKNAKEYDSLEIILKNNFNIIENHRNGVKCAIENNHLPSDYLEKFEVDMKKAVEIGVKRGIEGSRLNALITKIKQKKYKTSFKKFEVTIPENQKSIVLVTQDFPPNHNGGIASFNKDLAESLAKLGHVVHVITKSSDINKVDFENNVWVHRILNRHNERSILAFEKIFL